MNLISWQFLLLFVGACIVYFLVPLKRRWIVLLAASYIFYLYSSVRMTALLFLTTLVTYYTGKALGKINQTTSDYLAEHKADMDREERKTYRDAQTGKKRRVLLIAVLWDIGILCVLKYTGFVFSTINSVLAFAGIGRSLPVFSFLLPLGISFYTFQAVGYVIDVYRDKYAPDESLPRFMLFLSFFPQMIQGPIGRHDQLADQLYEGHKFDYTRITRGLQLILWGMIRKMVLADRIAPLVNEIFDNYLNYAGLTMFVGAAAYGIQMYADFSGGIDIARGIAQVFGIEMAENFKRPYFSKSLDEFWRRWHISLGNWMRDYVFYSVSLSRPFSRLGRKTKKWFGTQTGKLVPAAIASYITFLLVGIWHGASWKFVAYGIWNATIVSSAMLLVPVYKKMANFFHVDTKSKDWQVFSMVRTFFVCSLGRLFSRGVSLRATLTMMKSLFTVWNPQILVDGTLLGMGVTMKDWWIILIVIGIMLAVGIMQERGMKIRETIAARPIVVRWMIYLGAIVFLILFGVYGPGYAASDFVYQQF